MEPLAAYTVPTLSIIFMVVAMLAGIAFPVVMYLILRKKYHCDHMPFFIGCLVMLLFAFVLEQIAHTIILKSPLGTGIMSNIWLYGLYGGFMAGLFEEGGRFLAFKTVLKKKNTKDCNALMYGAGHGGFEAFYILTFSMINNLVLVVMMSAGGSEALAAGLMGDAGAQVQNAMMQLAATPSGLFLVSVLERGAAVIAQIALSVIVWFAAKGTGKRFWLFPLAILFHMVLDAGAVVMASYVSNVLWVELAVWAFAAVMVYVAYRVWKRCAKPSEPETVQEASSEALPDAAEENK